ncbi:MAG: FecR domain-containing protein [Leptospira sp.]|nr:FecR domain-containing protein [Leptospira sp.]
MNFKTKDEWISWIKEWKLGIFLFANAAIFFIIFYQDISQRAGIGSREVIGDITFKYNRIQRKFEREISWDPIDLNSPVTNRDSVRTEKNSIVAIKLLDGTEIDMDEDSMVILEISPKNRKIMFEKGSINIKKNSVAGESKSSIMVESKKGTVEVTDGDVIVAKNTQTSMDVAVSRGEATVSIDGQEIQLKKNQVLQTKNGGISAKDASVKMIDPSTKARNLEKNLASRSLNKLNLLDSNSSSTSSEIEAKKVTSPSIQSPPPTTTATPTVTKKKETTQPYAEQPTKNQTVQPAPSQQEQLKEKELQRKKEQAEFERFMKM